MLQDIDRLASVAIHANLNASINYWPRLFDELGFKHSGGEELIRVSKLTAWRKKRYSPRKKNRRSKIKSGEISVGKMPVSFKASSQPWRAWQDAMFYALLFSSAKCRAPRRVPEWILRRVAPSMLLVRYLTQRRLPHVWSPCVLPSGASG